MGPESAPRKGSIFRAFFQAGNKIFSRGGVFLGAQKTGPFLSVFLASQSCLPRPTLYGNGLIIWTPKHCVFRIEYSVSSIAYSALSIQYSVLSIVCSIFSIEYSAFSIEYSVLSIEYSILSIQLSVLDIVYLVLSIQYCVFSIEYFGLSLAAVARPLSGGRLRSSPIAACRRALAELAAPAGFGFPPYGRRLAPPWRRWGCPCLGDVSEAAQSQHTMGPSLT